uniref:3'-5' exonuclease domain-containing protein n=1 Tax=Globodera rostochiensis TaxID=31243 RepID=A0A914H2K6_GLORO
MSTIINENGTAQIETTVDNVGISVVAFTVQQLDDALRTVYTMHDMRHVVKQGQKQQQQNSGKKYIPRPPTPLETGIRLFSNVSAAKVLDFFIALLRHALDEDTLNKHSEGGMTIFRDGMGVEHVLVQSFFVWMEYAEKRYHKLTTATGSRSAAKEAVRSNEYDGFIPSQRTPSPPRKGGGRPKQRQRAIADEQQQQQQLQQQTPPAPLVDGQTQLSAMSDKATEDDNQQHQAVPSADKHHPAAAEPTTDTAFKNPGNNDNNTPAVGTTALPSQCLHRVLLTAFHREHLVELLAPLGFPFRTHSNIWRIIVNVLDLKQTKYLGRFVETVNEMVIKGRISFDLLSFCLQNFADKMGFTADHLAHALLLGPLCATIVEQFVTNRTEEFRAKTREVLLEIESWKFDEKKWRSGASTFAHRSHADIPNFKEFCTNITALLNELRNELSDRDNLVDPGWAHSLIKTAARKLYTEKTWKEEHFNDLIHTLLVQRPTMKSFLLNVLLKDHNDKRAHEKWRNFVSSERYRMSNTFDMVSLCSKDEQPQFLSLPRRCEVYEIRNVNQFHVFERQFDEYVLKKTKRVVIGVDAEWNPYVARSRASLLQLALIHSVYLLDLDALHTDKSFQQFIDRLFLSKTITKLGYQFGDDLVHLRIRLPDCIGLYRPQSIVCVGQLVEELNRRSRLLPNFPLDKFLLPITDEQEEELKDHTRQIKPQRYDAPPQLENDKRAAATKLEMNPTEERLQKQPCSSNTNPYEAEVALYAGHDAQGRLRRSLKKCRFPVTVASGNDGKSLAEQGLAYLCRRVLGKPLDKQEQCSVWDRRPLRRRQIRYAALDAHCLMQILHRCAEWSEQLGLDGDPIALMSTAQRFYAPLPLFCAFSMPKELLLTTTNATDGKVWGNELDDPNGWAGN